ncbi:ScbR family autoregulator-binding transcription factor [Streptomyces sp. ISL-94]|uniref:ScbR family autoregulator-binding transcription factor n=1 Tax=Streptomyces sp. ISL-94 TaxID=2819190 RepID=UPI001BEAF656|nr:ScbR family autoregulator-binding transcription factor [Streptomyces sp. ISL-94]MBT2479897.1 helix-turn-helix transcriptional regulator [Streptomyces sp. ISL-94]
MVKQERGARTREALVRAAAEVFAEQGFVTASIAVISRRAGVSAGGLHFHFGSKTALAQAVEDRAAQAVREITVGVAGSAAGSAAGAGAGGSALQVLVDATHALMALLARDVVVRAGFGLCADASWSGGVDLRGQWRLWVGEVVAAAAREGSLAEGLSPQDAARGVVAATVGLEVMGAYEREWVAPHTLTRFWTLMLPRLAAAGTLDGLLPQGSAGGVVPPGEGFGSD